MAADKKQMKEIRKLIEAEGGKIVEVSSGRRTHIKLWVELPNHETKMFVTSVSPSDRRTLLNFRAQIRREIRHAQEAAN